MPSLQEETPGSRSTVSRFATMIAGSCRELIEGSNPIRPADYVRAGILLVLLMAVYLSNGRSYVQGDSFGARHCAASLLKERNLDLDEFPYVSTEVFGIVESHGKKYSIFPPGPAFMAAPSYALLRMTGVPLVGEALFRQEKFAAAGLAALASSLLLLLLTRHVGPRAALILAALHGLATPNWMISSNALLQHAPLQVLMLAGLLVAKGENTWRKLLAGLLIGLMPFMRPADLPMAFFVGLILLASCRTINQVIAAAVGGVVGALALPAVNMSVFGTLGGAYAKFQADNDVWFIYPLWRTIGVLLVSPVLGLFVYSPFLLGGPLALLVLLVRRRWREALPWFLLTLPILANLITHGAYRVYYGGEPLFYGPRFLTSALPLDVMLLIPAARLVLGGGRGFTWRWCWTAAAALMVTWGVVLQAAGHYAYVQHFAHPYGNLQLRPEFFWQLRNAPWYHTISGKTLVEPPGAEYVALNPANGLIKFSDARSFGHCPEGLYGPEPVGAWSYSPKVNFWFSAPDPPRTVAAKLHSPQRAEMSLRLNGHLIGACEMESSGWEPSLLAGTIPAKHWNREGLNCLTIESTAEGYQPANTRDPRWLVFAIEDLTFLWAPTSTSP